jgi:adenine-specific DNA-methyltransferase
VGVTSTTARQGGRLAPQPGQAALFAEPLTAVAEHAGVEHGEVFTRRWVVDFILDLVGFTPDKDLAAAVAIEPSCGTGAFLVPMAARLLESTVRFGRPITDAASALVASDLLAANVEQARTAVEATLGAAGIAPAAAAALTEGWITQRDFLLDPPDWESADFVVGNPPYIRLEAVPKARAAAYRRACPTMGGRADIYVGFYEVGLRALKSQGVLGFICADRWLRNQYGSRLREMIGSGWSVDALVSMTGVDAFEDEVDAYPAITVIRRAEQDRGPLVVSASPEFGSTETSAVVGLAKRPSAAPVTRRKYTAARLGHWFEGGGGWPHGTPAELALLAEMESSHPPLEDAATGTRLGIGIATGADKVFITADPTAVEPERLVPLAFPSDIASGHLEWSGRYLINPWGPDGLVALEDWPKFAAFLSQHREQLAGRHTARRGHWFRTIDRLMPGLAGRPKLYLPDFKDRVFPVLDEGTTYPHHNLYWITSDHWDLQVLGGLLMSDVANRFIEAYSVRMRGGFLRFQAQYLRRIRVPSLESVGKRPARLLARAFEQRDHEAATAVAQSLYGLTES